MRAAVAFLSGGTSHESGATTPNRSASRTGTASEPTA